MPSFSIHKLQSANAHLTEQLRAYAYDVIGCCHVVHRDMGPFLNEYMYQEALAIAFHEASISARSSANSFGTYMRLTSTRIGILYNFAPVKDECERYYLDATTGMMYAF